MNRQQKTLHVHISNLATSVNVTSSATGIVTVSPATISAAEATAGKRITLTRDGGNNGAKLSISGNNITQSHTMSGN